jgi:hypothetical protein
MLRLEGLILRVRSNYKLLERRAKTDLLGIKIKSLRWSSMSLFSMSKHNVLLVQYVHTLLLSPRQVTFPKHDIADKLLNWSCTTI